VSVSKIETQNVIDNFPELINAWCQVNAKSMKIKQEMMCQEAIRIFGDGHPFSNDYVRKSVDSKFKISYRSANAHLKGLSKIQRLKRNASQLEKQLKENLYQVTQYEKSEK
jgi:hypothetical protein